MALCGLLWWFIWCGGSFCGCGCFRPSVELVACPGAFRIIAERSAVICWGGVGINARLSCVDCLEVQTMPEDTAERSACDPAGAYCVLFTVYCLRFVGGSVWRCMPCVVVLSSAVVLWLCGAFRHIVG